LERYTGTLSKTNTSADTAEVLALPYLHKMTSPSNNYKVAPLEKADHAHKG